MPEFDKDSERYFPASILILKYGTHILHLLFESVLASARMSLPEYLTSRQHSLFHMWNKTGCCQCSEHKILYASGSFLRFQFDDLFTVLGTVHTCPKVSVNIPCSCKFHVKKDTLVRSLDIPAVSCLLLNFENTRLEPEMTEAVSEIRRLRNEIIANGEKAKLTEYMYSRLWDRASYSIIRIADGIPDLKTSNLNEDIGKLKADPLDLYSTMDAVVVTLHGSIRDVAFLEDLKKAKEILNDLRRGELVPIIDMTFEAVTSTFGQKDPMIKDLQNVKLYLMEGKLGEMYKKLDEDWINRVIQARKQCKQQMELWQDRIFKMEGVDDIPSELAFCDSCGNVRLSDDRRHARWKHTNSAGLIFSNRPIKCLEHIHISITGSGEVAIGTTQTDPEAIFDQPVLLHPSQAFRTAIIVKVFDSISDVKLNLGSGSEANQMIVFCEGKRYVVDFDPSLQIWLTLYIRFGDVQVELCSTTVGILKFHECVGTNVQAINGNRRRVCLKHANPHAVCRLNRRLQCGEEIAFYLKYTPEHELKPRRFYIVLGITNEGFKNGYLNDDQPFTSPSRSWIMKKRFEDRTGKFLLSVSFRGIMSLSGPNKFVTSSRLTNREKKYGIAVFFELFRSEVEILSYKIKNTL